MRKRISSQKLIDQASPAVHALADHKQETVSLMIATIPEKIKFRELGDLLGYSKEWVRHRLVDDPKYRSKIFCVNGRYFVPRGVAVELVREIFN
jgi:hypothetical protein